MSTNERRDFLTTELMAAKAQLAEYQKREAELEAAINYLERQLGSPQPPAPTHGQAAVGIATGIDPRPLRGIANEAERILRLEGRHLTARDLYVKLTTRGFSVKPASVSRVLTRDRSRFYHYPDGWGLAVAPQDLGPGMVATTTNEAWGGRSDFPPMLTPAAQALFKSRWEGG